ncbi:Uma2 family endonuclease [Laspinema olomoucense]|uniref:Uma2 family endonuclease n=1 Tax=Laspinema olomoucense D3b TaxID=2953688 RepID=A0ABT2N5B3_9CYAN|nr:MULTISPECIES: Uma2 family endonuclease [unclassified Laspinema]MCT7976565.1 Uma2 family endonuclease [Laspinema sp. D3b]MCT7994993.1 Uma2 family endonuclease [Laspinema sp. D3c]
MIAVKSDHHISPEEYLERERHSPIKHEYLDGDVYAMAGTSTNHNIISGNLYIFLRNALQNSGCRTYFADIKVRIDEGKRFFYPDVLVNCDPTDNRNLAHVDTPKVIIEVLSESTESFDRGKKFQYYRKLSSLQDYILVSSQDYVVEIFHRIEGDRWVLETYQGLSQVARIESLDLNIPLAEIYATLNLTPVENPASEEEEKKPGF